MTDFAAFRLKRAQDQCLATITRACGTALEGLDISGLSLDAYPLLAKVFDGLRGQARAARLYTRLVDGPSIQVPEDAPGIEQAIIKATGKPVPARLKAALPSMNPASLWMLQHAIDDLLTRAKAAREKGRAR